MLHEFRVSRDMEEVIDQQAERKHGNEADIKEEVEEIFGQLRLIARLDGGQFGEDPKKGEHIEPQKKDGQKGERTEQEFPRF